MDALQPSGSFKIRGVGLACQEYYQKGARSFISSSGGNAGLAVAYAGRMLGIPVTVVVPETTSKRAIDLLRLEQAKVIVHGSSWQEANQLACAMVGDTDAFIHPFDDPLLWKGHATMIDEVVAAGVRPDAVVLSVGGGGLMCGVQFADDHRVVTEPACGAALAGVYEGKAVLDSFSNILVIVCGGATTTLEQLMLMSARLDIKGA